MSDETTQTTKCADDGNGSSIHASKGDGGPGTMLPAQSPTTTEGDIKLVREYLNGGSLWGRPHATEAFERLAELINHYVPKLPK